jgi:voltage-gated potassium channel
MRVSALKRIATALYEGDSPSAARFRYALLGFDIATVLFLVVSSFFYGHEIVEWLDIVFGVFILADFLARLWISRSKASFLLNPLGFADIVVAVSLLLPLLGENLAFLRVIRALRLFRSYRMMSNLKRDLPFFQKHQDIIFSVTNLFVFIFIMTALVFETQVEVNPQIHNYIDALYFTITALTTTGFGDITLQGTTGRALAILIMIFGVSLFIRLIQTVFRPSKVRFTCPDCSLLLHDIDAVHCKHCGHLLNIPNEGVV